MRACANRTEHCLRFPRIELAARHHAGNDPRVGRGARLSRCRKPARGTRSTWSLLPESPSCRFLTGRIREGLNQNVDALCGVPRRRRFLRTAPSPLRAACAISRCDTASAISSAQEVVDDLESLAAVWRGDETEVEALQLLAKLYIEDKRYRDAFNLMRVAVRAHPNPT